VRGLTGRKRPLVKLDLAAGRNRVLLVIPAREQLPNPTIPPLLINALVAEPTCKIATTDTDTYRYCTAFESKPAASMEGITATKVPEYLKEMREVVAFAAPVKKTWPKGSVLESVGAQSAGTEGAQARRTQAPAQELYADDVATCPFILDSTAGDFYLQRRKAILQGGPAPCSGGLVPCCDAPLSGRCCVRMCPSGTKPALSRFCVVDPLAFANPRDTASTLLYVGLDPWEFQRPGWKPVSQFFLNWDVVWAPDRFNPDRLAWARISNSSSSIFEYI
jgi:hypothetical protein